MIIEIIETNAEMIIEITERIEIYLVNKKIEQQVKSEIVEKEIMTEKQPVIELVYVDFYYYYDYWDID